MSSAIISHLDERKFQIVNTSNEDLDVIIKRDQDLYIIHIRSGRRDTEIFHEGFFCGGDTHKQREIALKLVIKWFQFKNWLSWPAWRNYRLLPPYRIRRSSS